MQSKSFIDLPRFLIISLLSVVLMGCFDTGDGPPSVGAGLSTGKITFSDVEGITFKSATQEGVTGPDSVFSYLPGELVTFAIGSVEDGIILGSVPGAPVITAFQLTGNAAGMLKRDSAAANLIRFIQSLDENREYLDGVTISEAVRLLAKDPGKPVLDFFADQATFDAQLQAVIDYLFVIPRTAASDNALDNFCNYTYLPGGGREVFGYDLEGCPEGDTLELLQNGGFEGTFTYCDFDAGFGPSPLCDDPNQGFFPEGWDQVLNFTRNCTDGFCDGLPVPAAIPGPGPFAGNNYMLLTGPDYFGKLFPEPEVTGMYQDFDVVGGGAYTASLMVQNLDGSLFSTNLLEISLTFSTDGNFEDGFGEYGVSKQATGEDDPESRRLYLPPGEWTKLEITTTATPDAVKGRFEVLHVQFPGEPSHTDFPGTIPAELISSIFIDDASVTGPTYDPEPPVEYELVWSDEFEHSCGSDECDIDRDNWRPDTGYGPPFNQGWGNNEWQSYEDDERNLRVEANPVPDPDIPGDGLLKITAYCDYLENPGNGSVPTNALSNASFELPDASGGDLPDDGSCTVNMDSWITSNCNFVSEDENFISPFAREGVQVLKQFGDNALASQDLLAAPDQVVAASAWAMSWGGYAYPGSPDQEFFANTARLQLFFLDSSGNSLDSSGVIISDDMPAFEDVADSARLTPQDGFDFNDWTQLAVSEIAPEGTAMARIQLKHELSGGSVTAPVWWDNASLTVSDPVCDIGNRNDSVTSAKIISAEAIDLAASSIQYGKIEASMKVPARLPTWAAFWMLGTSFDPDTGIGWPRSGEIDIMESWVAGRSDENTTHSTMHWCPKTEEQEEAAGDSCFSDWLFQGGSLDTGAPLSGEFHLYAVEWNPRRLLFTFDGQEVYRRDISLDNTMEEFKQPFYMILNLAVGGNLGSNGADPQSSGSNWELPQTMEVDYVRVYKAAP